jgi:metal-responsive CopG/Arc/MetJ family transcriptional regulator
MKTQMYESVKLKSELVQEYRKISQRTLIPLSRLICRAMEQYLESTRPKEDGKAS